MNHKRITAVAVLAIVATAMAVVAAEAALRLVQGYPLSSLRLRPPAAAVPIDPEANLARAYGQTLDVAPGVDRAWFNVTPAPPVLSAPDAILDARVDTYWTLGITSWYEWNRQYLEAFACGDPTGFADSFGRHKDLFVFEPLNPGPFPTFRFLRRAHYPSALVTNECGWRGPRLALNKPDRTIRVAFVGASTTVGAHGGTPASYPEFIGVWLNLWAQARGLGVRFEVINAGREGINSNSTAEVVRQEVLPLEPDLVVYYEGSNQFWPSSFIEWPDGKVPERPRRDPREPLAIENVLLLAVRARSAYNALTGLGSEPAKPVLPVRWPAELDEFDPDLKSSVMPLSLNVILADLDTMRMAVEASGSELVLSSFFWLVQDGMRLDPVRNDGVYSALNRTFWPFSYAHMRRMADFQNRVFAKYARARGIDFVDFSAAYPRDPELMVDAIHFRPEGIRVQAWVMFQRLIPLIERRLASGRLPRPDRTPLTEHPAFAQNPRRLEPVSSFGTHCAK